MSDPLLIALVTVVGGGLIGVLSVWIKEVQAYRRTKLRLSAERRARHESSRAQLYEETGIRRRSGHGTVPQRLDYLDDDVAGLKESDFFLRSDLNDFVLSVSRDTAELRKDVGELQQTKRRGRAELVYDLVAVVSAASVAQYLAGLADVIPEPHAGAIPWLIAVTALYAVLALYRLVV